MATVALQSPRTARASAYFGTAASYLSGNYRIPRRSEIIGELLGPVTGKDVIDLGCGNGALSAPLVASGNRVTMVDQSADMLAEAQRISADCVHADLLTFDRGPGFDVVLCVGVLAHADSTTAVLAAVARSLKAGGRAVVQFSDSERFATRLLLAATGLRARLTRRGLRYRPTPAREVVAAAEGCGLRLIAVRRHLLLAPGLARLLGKWLVPFDRFVTRRRWLARHATDAIMLLERVEN